MSTRLIIEGNSVYEIDEDCLTCNEKISGEKREEIRKSADRIEHRRGAGGSKKK